MLLPRVSFVIERETFLFQSGTPLYFVGGRLLGHFPGRSGALLDELREFTFHSASFSWVLSCGPLHFSELANLEKRLKIIAQGERKGASWCHHLLYEYHHCLKIQG